MQTHAKNYRSLLFQEVENTPEEFQPILLKMVRIFRESLSLKPAEDSFRQGWNEVISGETHPLEQLWEGIDAE